MNRVRKNSLCTKPVKAQIFGDIKEVYWILKSELSTDRENNVRDCFKDQYVDFKYPNNFESFYDLLEIKYHRKKSDYNENYLGENMILEKKKKTRGGSG